MLSIVSLRRVRSSMAASQFCIRISEASLPHSEFRAFLSVAGTWGGRRHGAAVSLLYTHTHTHTSTFSLGSETWVYPFRITTIKIISFFSPTNEELQLQLEKMP